ncbi:hypothetical protein BC829DRAFT_415179 [Chytridium lagenaria]|nr:hypothetical protein BC829DRAFT_415179 [Chytridium lagenaria]
MQFIRRYATRAAPSFHHQRHPFVSHSRVSIMFYACHQPKEVSANQHLPHFSQLGTALKASGHRVGLLDADLFGPSIPLMMNLRGKAGITEKNKLQPLENYGVKCMSMGFLIDEGAPVVWRGTGDVQLSIAQQVKIAEILGLVQNMSFFQCSSCGNKSHVFGYNGAIKKATALGIPILGEIPLHEDICETSDMGRPIVVSKPDSPLTKEYLKMQATF